MKKITLAILIVLIYSLSAYSNKFKKEILSTWVYESNGRKVTISFNKDNKFKYLEKQLLSEGKTKVIHDLDGEFKLRGRYIDMAFSNKLYMRLTILQMFFGADTVNYIIKDDYGRTYQTIKPKIEVTKTEKAAKEQEGTNGTNENASNKKPSNGPVGNQAGSNQ